MREHLARQSTILRVGGRERERRHGATPPVGPLFGAGACAAVPPELRGVPVPATPRVNSAARPKPPLLLTPAPSACGKSEESRPLPASLGAAPSSPPASLSPVPRPLPANIV